MVQRGDDLPRLEWPDVFHSPHHVPLAFQRRRGKIRQMARDVDGTGLLARADRCCFDKEPRFGNCIRAHKKTGPDITQHPLLQLPWKIDHVKDMIDIMTRKAQMAWHDDAQC